MRLGAVDAVESVVKVVALRPCGAVYAKVGLGLVGARRCQQIDVLQAGIIGRTEVEIVDMLGQLIFECAYFVNYNTWIQPLFLANLAEGAYYLRVKVGETDKKMKLLISR